MIQELTPKLRDAKIAGDPREIDGAYRIRRGSATLGVIASNGCGWEHVSVSLPTRCPTWEEMAFVKSLFFEPEELAIEIHPKASAYINVHPFCLHIWRPVAAAAFDAMMPPSFLVGPSVGTRQTEGAAP